MIMSIIPGFCFFLSKRNVFVVLTSALLPSKLPTLYRGSPTRWAGSKSASRFFAAQFCIFAKFHTPKNLSFAKIFLRIFKKLRNLKILPSMLTHSALRLAGRQFCKQNGRHSLKKVQKFSLWSKICTFFAALWNKPKPYWQ